MFGVKVSGLFHTLHVLENFLKILKYKIFVCFLFLTAVMY